MRSEMFLCVLMYLDFDSPTRADWQYTKWGMTPAQVADASKGTVKIEKPDPKSLNDPDLDLLECIGFYYSGTFRFTVVFGFDHSHHLRDVTLFAIGAKLIDEVLAALQEKYGPMSEGTRRIDESDNYSIEISQVAEVLSIHYKPLHVIERQGL